MNKNEFKKLNYCLELLAINDIISEKKKELKLEFPLRKSKLYEDEIEQFIEISERKKILLKNIIKEEIKLNYNNAIKFAKENKEKYIQLYNLNHANHYSNILYYLRNAEEIYLTLFENIFKKAAKQIFEELVQE